MTNVVNLDSKRNSATKKLSHDELERQMHSVLFGPDADNDAESARHSNILDDLAALSSDQLVRKLQLIHRKEAARREWTAEEDAMAAEIEVAVYMAYTAGVPEEAIYDLDDKYLSDALSSAINKVQDQA